jgi:hypothetical protein
MLETTPTLHHPHRELTMNPMIIHLAAQQHTRELHGVTDHARRSHLSIRRTRRTPIATPLRFGRRAPRPAAA